MDIIILDTIDDSNDINYFCKMIISKKTDIIFNNKELIFLDDIIKNNSYLNHLNIKIIRKNKSKYICIICVNFKKTKYNLDELLLLLDKDLDKLLWKNKNKIIKFFNYYKDIYLPLETNNNISKMLGRNIYYYKFLANIKARLELYVGLNIDNINNKKYLYTKKYLCGKIIYNPNNLNILTSVQNCNIIKNSASKIILKMNNNIDIGSINYLKYYLQSSFDLINPFKIKNTTDTKNLFGSKQKININIQNITNPFNKKFKKNLKGTRKEVYEGKAFKTTGGLKNEDLILNNKNKIVSKKLSNMAKTIYYKNNLNIIEGGSNKNNLVLVGYFFRIPSKKYSTKLLNSIIFKDKQKIITNTNFFNDKFIIWILLNKYLLPKKYKNINNHIPYIYMHGTKQSMINNKSFNNGMKRYCGSKNGLYYSANYFATDIKKVILYSKRNNKNIGTYPIIFIISNDIIYVENIPKLFKIIKAIKKRSDLHKFMKIKNQEMKIKKSSNRIIDLQISIMEYYKSNTNSSFLKKIKNKLIKNNINIIIAGRKTGLIKKSPDEYISYKKENVVGILNVSRDII